MKSKLCHNRESQSTPSLSNNAALNKNDTVPTGSQPVVITNRQSNHGSFYLPFCVAHLVNPPFYLAVAHWGLMLRQPFSRDDIAREFKVTPRRAADVMSYIMYDRSNVIDCVRHLFRDGPGARHLHLEIIGVSSHIPAPRPPQTPRKPAVSKDELRLMRTRFLTGTLLQESE